MAKPAFMQRRLLADIGLKVGVEQIMVLFFIERVLLIGNLRILINFSLFLNFYSNFNYSIFIFISMYHFD